jgi:hypothetical protein
MIESLENYADKSLVRVLYFLFLLSFVTGCVSAPHEEPGTPLYIDYNNHPESLSLGKGLKQEGQFEISEELLLDKWIKEKNFEAYVELVGLYKNYGYYAKAVELLKSKEATEYKKRIQYVELFVSLAAGQGFDRN